MHFGVPSCIALELDIILDAYEDKKLVLMLGEEDEDSVIDNTQEKFKTPDLAYNELRLTKEYWNNILRRVQVKTKQDEIDFMLNGWAMYQTIVCRIFARSRILSVRRSLPDLETNFKIA